MKALMLLLNLWKASLKYLEKNQIPQLGLTGIVLSITLSMAGINKVLMNVKRPRKKCQLIH